MPFRFYIIGIVGTKKSDLGGWVKRYFKEAAVGLGDASALKRFRSPQETDFGDLFIFQPRIG
jgi:hypothetical protein